jgi:hypothetical protein
MFGAVHSLLRTAGRVALIGSKIGKLPVPEGFQVVPMIELAPIDSLVMLSKV